MTAAMRRFGLVVTMGLVIGTAGEAKADVTFEITVTGQIDYISDTLGLLDSSVQIGTPYKMTFIFSYNATPIITGQTGLAAYGFVPQFSSQVTYGDYKMTSTGYLTGNMAVWNDYVFSGRGETDGFQIFSEQNSVVTTNPNAKPLFNTQNSVDAFGSSHSVFSSTQLPPLSVYNAVSFQNTTSSNTLDFVSFVHPSSTDYTDTSFVGGSYSTISAQYITPEPSTLVPVIIVSILGVVNAWRCHARADAGHLSSAHPSGAEGKTAQIAPRRLIDRRRQGERPRGSPARRRGPLPSSGTP